MKNLRYTAQDWLVKYLGPIGWLSSKLAAAIAVRRFTTPRAVPHPGWERELMKRGRSVRLASDTRATIWGDDGPRKVFLVHGWNGRGAQLGKCVEPLLHNGFQVIAWDAPAHGDSGGSRTNIREFAETLSEAARELGPVYGVIAHSFGTAATAMAISRGWMKAERLVFAAAPASLDWITDHYVNHLRMTKEVERDFRHQLETWVGLNQIETSPAALALTLPTLLAHDPKDNQVPFSESEKIARKWPRARLLPLENVGHSKILKRHEFVDAAVKFFQLTNDAVDQ